MRPIGGDVLRCAIAANGTKCSKRAAGNEIQPSLRDWRISAFVPSVETLGYFRGVPTGLEPDPAS
jgi:hypothetical protein